MMEKLGAPQTHVGLKNMIAEIDEDNDGKVSYREVNNGVLSLIHDVQSCIHSRFGDSQWGAQKCDHF